MRILGCRIIRKGKKSSDKIALTFDDGPHPKFTPRILDVLAEFNAKATFFITGRNISANKGIAEEIIKRGHILGNHTYNHPRAYFIGRGKLFDEISRTKDLIEDISVKPNRYFRPPYGIITPSMLSVCARLELSIVLWDSNSKDYRREKADTILDRIYKGLKPGSIILFHDRNFADESLDYTNTISALKSFLEKIILKGLKPVTIEEML